MIYIVEDDNTIRDMEIYTLQQTGFEACGFASGKEMFDALMNQKPDLIVLDIMLPEMDGMEILNNLRKDSKYSDIPVIMATAKGTEMDKIIGLNSGADDYLVKPFGMLEMVARINAVLRRTAKNKETILTSGSISLNEKSHTVIVDGKNIELTNKEFSILRLFLKNVNMVFTREKLMNEVWGSDYVGESRTVDMHIKTLRQKLGNAGGQIKTVIGVGYRLENEL